MNYTTDPGWNLPSALVEKDNEIDALKRALADRQEQLDWYRMYDDQRDRELTDLYDFYLNLRVRSQKPLTSEGFQQFAKMSLLLEKKFILYQDKNDYGPPAARAVVPQEPRPVNRSFGGRQLFADS